MKKVNNKTLSKIDYKTINNWKQGKKSHGFHPTGYNEIGWKTVKHLERLTIFNNTKCCATGTCLKL